MQSQNQVWEVRVVPKIHGHYVVEVVYEVEYDEVNDALNDDLIASIDLGINNLATVASNKDGFQPFAVNGRPLKSLNHRYNKHLAQMKSDLELENQKRGLEIKSSHRIRQLTYKRHLRVKQYLHQSSRMIVDRLVAEGIGTLIIGYNKGWKQKVKMGDRNNQNFVDIPFLRFVEMIQYKAKMAGIEVFITEESYHVFLQQNHKKRASLKSAMPFFLFYATCLNNYFKLSANASYCACHSV